MDSYSVKEKAMIAVGFRLIAGDQPLSSADYFVAYKNQFGPHGPGEVIEAVDQLVKEGMLMSSHKLGQDEGWNMEHHFVVSFSPSGQQYFNDLLSRL